MLAGIPLHGGDLFPRQFPRLRSLVLAYLDALTSLGQAVLAGVALSLGLGRVPDCRPEGPAVRITGARPGTA